MNESHDPDDWEGDPHPIAIALVELFFYAIYCVIVYKVMTGSN